MIDYKYKIYGRRRGRKKKRLKNVYELLNQNSKKINLFKKNFNILDIGSGSGENSLKLSNMHPSAQIVACDNFLDGNLNLLNEIYLNKIKNILLYEGNVNELLDKISKENIFDDIWILFPDPWPKKRHYKRRLINNEFMKKLIKLIKINGSINIASDSPSYLRKILCIIYDFKEYFLWTNQSIEAWSYDTNVLAETKFYKKAIKYSRKPIYIKLKKL